MACLIERSTTVACWTRFPCLETLASVGAVCQPSSWVHTGCRSRDRPCSLWIICIKAHPSYLVLPVSLWRWSSSGCKTPWHQRHMFVCHLLSISSFCLPCQGTVVVELDHGSSCINVSRRTARREGAFYRTRLLCVVNIKLIIKICFHQIFGHHFSMNAIHLWMTSLICLGENFLWDSVFSRWV